MKIKSRTNLKLSFALRMFFFAIGIMTFTANAQTYTLSKGLTVGCSGGNPLTDITKKIDIVKDDKGTRIKYASLNCSREYSCIQINLANGSNAFWNTNDKIGVIITSDDRMGLFTFKDGKYEIQVGGHLDKKQAKEVTSESMNAEFQSVLSNFDDLIKKGIEEAKRAEMLANILPTPELSLTDEWGLSGLYYMSELSGFNTYSNSDEAHGKYTQAVYMYLDKEDKYIYKAYYSQTGYDKFYFDGTRAFKAFKEGGLKPVYRFKGDNMNKILLFKDISITYLEEGLYLVNKGGWYRTSNGCTDVVWAGNKTEGEYILLGKNKERIEQLMSNPDEIKKLSIENIRAECAQSDALEAAEKPMPTPSSMNTPQLSKDATAVTLKWAQARWAQELQYVFVHGKDWNIHRHQVTGVILARGIWCIAIMKEKDGTCKWEEVYVKQDYDGAKYGATYFSNETTVIVPVDCATAMKYKK
ncbi:MAG: hypothetical protein R2780_04415 [Crocinitomicaceae bacterium]|nr:hypothetical protein [Crocinitomicaceae bacterium]